VNHFQSDSHSPGTPLNIAPVLIAPHRAYEIGHGHPLRARVEDFIGARFRDAHGARITHFMPRLFAIFNKRGKVLAALGIRPASEALFLEHYLDQPIETLIADLPLAADRPVQRDRLVEIGNLASIDRNASLRLFRFLAAYLIEQGFEWASFTGGETLRRIFALIGIETVSLGKATQERLPAGDRHWGRYYDDNPCILAGRVDSGRSLIADHPAHAEVAA
jgi:hypothetical protein